MTGKAATEIVPASSATLDRAARILRAGGLVAFPTETVYGLGADATQPSAVAKIFAAKGRPSEHPVIVHLADTSWLTRWAAVVPPAANALAKAFWPGPLTLILRRSGDVPDVVTGGGDTVGLRMPAHPVAQGLIERLGRAVAAPSANRFGRISPTRAEHVAEELGGRIDLIVDGGPCEVGVESTIVDLSGASPRLLRFGGVALEAIEDVLGATLAAGSEDAPRAPGTLDSHYAPDARTLVLPRQALLDAAQAGDASLVLEHCPERLGSRCRALPAEPVAAAHAFYADLRGLDAMRPERILIELPPDTPPWRTVRDRMFRAAAPR